MVQKTNCLTCGRVFNEQEDYFRYGRKFVRCDAGHLWFDCSCGSAHMLESGQYDWYDAGHWMRPKTASIFHRIKQIKELPLFPSETAQTLAMINNEEVSSDKLEQQIKKNPMLALDVIETANRMKTAKGNTIGSVSHAINYIGRDTLRDIITKAVASSFRFESKVFSRENFWEEASLTGFIAEVIIERYKLQLDSHKAYLAGTLCNIGKVVGAICFGKLTDEVYQLTYASQHPVPWSEAEKMVDAISHCTLGEIAATLWGLPDYVRLAAIHHHTRPSRVKATLKRDVFFKTQKLNFDKAKYEYRITDVITLANQYTHWVRLAPYRMNINLFNSCLERLGIPVDEGDRFGEDLLVMAREHELVA